VGDLQGALRGVSSRVGAAYRGAGFTLKHKNSCPLTKRGGGKGETSVCKTTQKTSEGGRTTL